MTLNLNDPKSRRPRISTTPNLDNLKSWRTQISTIPNLDNSESRRPQIWTTPKLDGPESQQPWNSTLKSEGPRGASSDFYDFFRWATAQFTGILTKRVDARELLERKKGQPARGWSRWNPPSVLVYQTQYSNHCQCAILCHLLLKNIVPCLSWIFPSFMRHWCIWPYSMYQWSINKISFVYMIISSPE